MSYHTCTRVRILVALIVNYARELFLKTVFSLTDTGGNAGKSERKMSTEISLGVCLSDGLNVNSITPSDSRRPASSFTRYFELPLPPTDVTQQKSNYVAGPSEVISFYFSEPERESSSLSAKERGRGTRVSYVLIRRVFLVFFLSRNKNLFALFYFARERIRERQPSDLTAATEVEKRNTRDTLVRITKGITNRRNFLGVTAIRAFYRKANSREFPTFP